MNIRDERMKCNLCEKPIEEYHPELNHLRIDDTHEVDICPECLSKLVKWQGGVITRLFPTSAMKKKYGRKE
jgi:hypothetical protein